MRRRSVLVGAAAAALAPVVGQPGVAAAAGGTLADRLHTLPAATRQVVIVHGPGGTSTDATLQAFAKVNGVWKAATAGLPARIGRNGFSDHHREGDGTTPTGVYAFGTTMYGLAANPGVRFAYRRLVRWDWWDENPRSSRYNTFRHTSIDPGGGSEALWRISPQYTHFAVIAYNMPPTVAEPVPYAGSGIFLHQSGSTAGPTAGCVSVAHTHLVTILNWLNPAHTPRIVLSPNAALGRY